MAQAPSTFIVTGPNFEQRTTDGLQVLPKGGSLPSNMNQNLGGNRPVTAAITAGTTQTIAGATQLYTGFNFIATVGTAGDAVKLPAVAPIPGQSAWVFNNGASACAVFPFEATVTTIDGGTAGASVTLTNAKNAEFIQSTGTTWVSAQGGAKSA